MKNCEIWPGSRMTTASVFIARNSFKCFSIEEGVPAEKIAYLKPLISSCDKKSDSEEASFFSYAFGCQIINC